MSFAGHDVVTVVPVAVTPGNVGVSFENLSYAGQLVVTVVADPDVVGEQDLLTSRLKEEFSHLVCQDGDPRASPPTRRPLPVR